MEQFKIEDVVIAYEIKRNKRAKRIKITVEGERVKVSAPQRVSKKRIKDFVESNKDWIYEHLQENKKFIKKYADGEIFLYKGKEYVLRINFTESSKVKVDLAGNIISLTVSQDMDYTINTEYIKGVLTGWYKEKSKKIFKEKLDYYADLMGVTYNTFRIKDQKTRWGSCSTKGNINLNWRIIMASEDVIDYLVIHELAHLRFMNHSQEFWNLVGSFKPDYKRWRKWLKEKGKMFFLY